MAGEQNPAFATFYGQDLSWRDCDNSLTCARVVVPLDWAEPEGETITLSLIRHSAPAGAAQGSIFVDPGGPGQSGVALIRDEFSAAVDARLAASFDIIGFDPRGVGESTPVKCTKNGAEMDAFLYGITPGVRGSAEWIDAKEVIASTFIAGCQKYSGALLEHIDTLSVAHDLDVMRAVVGEAQLDYLGYSYGTFIGEVYAQEFPNNVAHMVLDGAVDPSVEGTETADQAAGFDLALGNWIAWCTDDRDCPFEGSAASVETQISDILVELDATPQAAGDGRLVGADTFVTGITAGLYSPDTWRDLSDLFVDYFDGSVDSALALADWWNERYDDGSYVSNQTEAFIAIGCADSPPSDESTWATAASDLEQEAPMLGRYFAYGDIMCSLWPYQAVFATAGMTDTGPAPIVVIGTTADPSTPIAWAEGVVEHLTEGRLITYTGEGHTGYNKGNACVDTLVDDYFTDRVVLPAKSRC
jgi:pimeloyl-ACP methyl ester carboxylesterase